MVQYRLGGEESATTIAATCRGTQKLMLNGAINYVYAQQLCLPHGLNTLVGRNQNGYITPAFSGSPWQGELNLEKSGCDGAKKGWKWVKLGEN